jgi:glycine hydroxymethyltransferase
MTTRGFGVVEAKLVGQLMADVLDAPQDEAKLAAVRERVHALTAAFPVYR